MLESPIHAVSKLSQGVAPEDLQAQVWILPTWEQPGSCSWRDVLE